MHRTHAQNSQREGRGPLFQWAVGISVWFSTETTGSLRNPETRRTPSYTLVCIHKGKIKKKQKGKGRGIEFTAPKNLQTIKQIRQNQVTKNRENKPLINFGLFLQPSQTNLQRDHSFIFNKFSLYKCYLLYAQLFK